MMTEENEYFEDDMIVEFKYVMENEEGWRWVPLRVRYDKTAELRAGLKNYGNAYHVANNNWHSIHHPITDYMILLVKICLNTNQVMMYITTVQMTKQIQKDFVIFIIWLLKRI